MQHMSAAISDSRIAITMDKSQTARQENGGEKKDKWADYEDDSEESLFSSELGRLVVSSSESAANFEPYITRRKRARRCRPVVRALLLTMCVVVLIAVSFGLGLLAAKVALRMWPGGEGNNKPVYQYQHAAVATDAGPCSEEGRDILKQGGSAVDAAIAALVCIGLFNPESTSIAGGHVLMYYHAHNQAVEVIDAFAKAPLNAYKDMYVAEELNSTDLSSTKGAVSIAVPGDVAGFWKAHQSYGLLDWKKLFQPTIKYAREGFNVTPPLAETIFKRMHTIREDPMLSESYLKEDGTPLLEGDIIYRHKYADTLEKIANGGADAFYRGKLAEDIVKDIQDRGGIITIQDLNQYQAKRREPLVIRLENGLRVYTTPPPSSGAVLSLILNILDGFGLGSNSFSSTNATISTFHKMVEAFKFGHAKRASLGDEDYVDVKQVVANMISRDTADIMRSKITEHSTHNSQYYGGVHSATDDHGTTHICILDQNGNAVSLTGSINLYFGSEVIGSRTGILFNDAMDDFTTSGEPNHFGLPPSASNFIEPGKRPMSSMSPTIVVDKEGDVRLVIGASGGSRIISNTAQVFVRNIWGGFSVSDAIRRKRLHHQWLPDYIQYEEGFDQDIPSVLAGLKAKGHKLQEVSYLSIVQAISRSKEGVIEAFSDERKSGYPAGF